MTNSFFKYLSVYFSTHIQWSNDISSFILKLLVSVVDSISACHAEDRGSIPCLPSKTVDILADGMLQCINSIKKQHNAPMVKLVDTTVELA